MEEITRLPLARAFRSLLRFDEIGLRCVYLETLEGMPPHCGIRMHQYLGNLDATHWDPSFDLYGGGGLVCSAADLGGFWSALFAGRVFEADETLHTMLISLPASNREVGLGLFRQRFGAFEAWAHSGFCGSFALHEPRLAVTITGSTNQAIARQAPRAFEHLRQRLFEVVMRSLETGA